jgi:transposase
MLQKIYHFGQWDKVLREFGLKPVKNQWVKISKELPRAMYGGGGESEEHKRLKEYIA